MNKTGNSTIVEDMAEEIRLLDFAAIGGDEASAKKVKAIDKILRRNFIPSVMAEAEDLIYGDREQTYGDPSKNLARIAELWTSFLQKNLRDYLQRNWHKLDGDIRHRGINNAFEESFSGYLREITTGDKSLRLSVTDICRMMQSLKWARDEHNPKRDNIVDDIGYAGLVHRCREPRYVDSIPAGVGANLTGQAIQGTDKVEVRTTHRRKSKSQSKRKR